MTTSAEFEPCEECGDPAITEINGEPLCADCASIVENAEALDKIAAVFQRPGFWDEVADGADFREIADIVLLTGRNVGPYPAGN